MDSGKLQRESLIEYEPHSLEVARPALEGYLPPDQSQEFKIWEYWGVLAKRKWVVLAAIVIVVTMTAIASFRTQKEYEASARLAIYREIPLTLGQTKDTDFNTADDWDASVDLDTQVRIIQSDTLALDVIKRLQLHRNVEFAGPAANAAAVSLDGTSEIDPAMVPGLLGQFHGGLRVNVLPRTRIIEIRFMSPSPRLAADIVNTVATAFIEQNYKTKFQSTMATSEWLSRQLADLKITVETSQEKLVRYQKENGILGIDDKQNIVTSKLDYINSSLTNAEADRMQKQANYMLSLSGDPNLGGKEGDQSFLQAMRSRMADLKDQYAQASTQFGPNYPKVLELKNQLAQVQETIAGEETRLRGKAKDEYLAALQHEKLLMQALEDQKGEANKLNEKAIEYSLLKREVESNRALYESLLQKLKEATMAAGLKSSNVRVVDSARVPNYPAKPNIPRNLEIAFLAGLLGGVAMAFVLEGLDNTVRTPEQIQMISGLASLGVIPMSNKVIGPGKTGRPVLSANVPPSSDADPVELISYVRPKSEIAESYRALRTSILLSSLGAPPKLILVTSALPQEGKTTTSVNTAIVLAQKGARVLLIDADLRRPSIHKTLGLKPRCGLTSVLTGSETLESAIIPAVQSPNLFVLPAGPHPPHPAELVGSVAMKELLKRCRGEYDHIVIDTPPVLSVTDAVVLSVEADANILVIRSRQTTKEALRRARDLLCQVNARVLGVVLNAVNLNAADYYYYYYGSKYDSRYYAYDDQAK